SHPLAQGAVRDEAAERVEPLIVRHGGKVRLARDAHRGADTDGTHDEWHARAHILHGLQPRFSGAPRIVGDRIDADVERSEIISIALQTPCSRIDLDAAHPRLTPCADDGHPEALLARELLEDRNQSFE